jgi:SNF2 family DNA or RNA helicase
METEQERLRASGKYLMLSRILEKLHRTGHRVLLFSQMVRALEIVQDMLEAAGYKFLRLDGKTKVRAAALPQKPPPPIVLSRHDKKAEGGCSSHCRWL